MVMLFVHNLAPLNYFLASFESVGIEKSVNIRVFSIIAEIVCNSKF